MNEPHTDKLLVTDSNLAVLRSHAEAAGVTVEEFTDEAVELGCELAGVVVEEAPAPVYLAIKSDVSSNDFDLYPIEFGPGEVTQESIGEVLALEKLFNNPAKQQLPMAPELLAKATDMAMLLCVERRMFVGSSLFYRWLFETALQQGKEVLVRYPDGMFSELYIGDDSDEPEAG